MEDHGSPWTFGDVKRLLLATAAAVSVGVASWFLGSGESSVSDQVRYVNVSIVGLIIAGYANATWLLRGASAVKERRQTLLEEIDREHGRGRHVTLLPAADDTLFAAGDTLTLYHRRGCAMAAGRDFELKSRSQHEAAGLEPCGVCRP